VSAPGSRPGLAPLRTYIAGMTTAEAIKRIARDPEMPGRVAERVGGLIAARKEGSVDFSISCYRYVHRYRAWRAGERAKAPMLSKQMRDSGLSEEVARELQEIVDELLIERAQELREIVVAVFGEGFAQHEERASGSATAELLGA